ncbi:hypothetical protein VKT23_009166 [Stygiomarasmius scandens]|uniref:Metallo-dependent phosphatase n=1 Tax=Marasmiellus scandens TaxID=2682957 RepID=A0ABR1JH69_9AGAR
MAQPKLLNLVHWNDVYRISPQKPIPHSNETIDVAQFAQIVEDIRAQWPTGRDGKKDGLTLFSGDLFSPSVESSVTRGSQMVPVINYLAPDAALTGNHDFDFGYPHLTELVKDCTFPWILSNITDTNTSQVPAGLSEFQIFERAGLKIGVIGLVEKDWIDVVSSWPPNFVYKDLVEVGLELSKRLRDPAGDYKCDLILALTHCRLPNDVSIAKKLVALSPSAQKTHSIASTQGADIILGGHDHMYFASKGMTSWDNYDLSQVSGGGEEDDGSILLFKSGYDFRELSELQLELVETPKGSVRNVVISKVTGRRHETKPGSPASPELAVILKDLTSSVSESLNVPVCKTSVLLDVRSTVIRTDESLIGNWLGDIFLHAYDTSPNLQQRGGADGVLFSSGTMRGDSQYGPGIVTLGNIMEILPFLDTVVCIEIDGATLWDALENGFSKYPSTEGRFPAISGFRVSWDSRREPGQRVLGIWLTKEVEDEDKGAQLVDAEPIERTKGGRKYAIMTTEYCSEGNDGYTAFKGSKYLVDEENGQLLSAVVRKYLLGSNFVNKATRLSESSPSVVGNLKESTKRAVKHEHTNRCRHRKHRDDRQESSGHEHRQQRRSREHYKNHLHVACTEHMSSVDPVDGKKIRRHCHRREQGEQKQSIIGDKDNGGASTGPAEEDLVEISPVIDGRLVDEARK